MSAMGKLDSYYQGRRSETLAEAILSNITFTVPVSVKSDVGIDFFCTLYTVDKKSNQRYLNPSSLFGVQVKSTHNDVILSKFNINYLSGLEIPFLLGIVDRENLSISVYSCQQILHLFLKFGNPARSGNEFSIKLEPIDRYSQTNLQHNLFELINNKYNQSVTPGSTTFDSLLLDTKNNRWVNESHQITLQVGPRISDPITLADVHKEEERQRLINIFFDWIELDYFNKYNHKQYLPVPLFRYYENETLKEHIDIWYHHIENTEREIYPHLSARFGQLFCHLDRTIEEKPNLVQNEVKLLKSQEFAEQLRKMRDWIVEKNKAIREKNTKVSYWTEYWDDKFSKKMDEVIKKSQAMKDEEHSGH